jgi:hypothetical protein
MDKTVALHLNYTEDNLLMEVKWKWHGLSITLNLKFRLL